MKFTWSWLQDHLETTMTVSECAVALTRLGFEVEGVIQAQFEHFLVGHVTQCLPHPNADRLRLCHVIDQFDGVHQVVCGATNVREGLKVILAVPGALIPSTKSVLKKGVIRSIESFGMICSAEELGVSEQAEGILELPNETPLHADVATLLGCGDSVIDIAITPNRGDAFSVRGIARDLVAGGYGRLKPLVFKEVPVTDLCPVNVVLQTSACTLFTGASLLNIHKAETPLWVAKRLEQVGLKMIHPAVDIANYICLDIGRPLHIFDLDKLGDKLIVRQAAEGEILDGLDDKKYTLNELDIVTADPRAALGIAGIMGGVGSAVSEETTNIFIESAYFDPLFIRRTGQRLKIISESRTRFERGVDAEDVIIGLRYALSLLHDLCGGSASQMVTVKTAQPKPIMAALHFSAEAFRARTGVHLSFDQAVLYLQRLGCHFERQTPISVRVIPPSWRHDITSTEDLIEEVLRLHGYDSLPLTELPPAYIEADQPIMRLKQLVAMRGLSEVYTWSLVSEKEADPFGGGIPLNDPLSKDMAVLRPSVLIGLLRMGELYRRRSFGSCHLFEIAHQFTQDQERAVIAGFRMGQMGSPHWQYKACSASFFHVKADVEALLELVGITRVQWEKNASRIYHPERSAVIKQGKVVIGFLGELHPAFSEGIPMVGFELFLDVLLPAKSKKITPHVVSPYQRVVRDFSFLVDNSVSSESLLKAIKKVNYVDLVYLFDVYEGVVGKKALGIQVIFQPQEKTFSEADLLQLHTAVVSVVSQCGGVLRD